MQSVKKENQVITKLNKMDRTPYVNKKHKPKQYACTETKALNKIVWKMTENE